MSVTAYLKDRILLLVLQVVCMFVLSTFLLAVGNQVSTVVLILCIWLILVTGYMAVQYTKRARYFKRLSELSNQLEQRYLLAEVMDKPHRAEDLEYYKLLRSANKSMIEQITHVRNERKAYKEYIEQWVHEVKTPIAAMKLISENSKSDTTRKILMELEKTDQYVEQALYYARSEQVDKDYLVKELTLSDCVHASIMKNKQMLIHNRVQVKMEQLDRTVYSDSKWVEFMINQLLINAVQYRKPHHEAEPSTITIFTEQIKNGIGLVIQDNGIGIAESELQRVFEKGFTGSNGRQEHKSTGIGLYLCKRLCHKLGLDIAIRSVPQECTAVTIFFPMGTLYKIQD